ncbi:hypothetical protein DWV68_14210 [Roseburia sp. AF12-17LB]|nr:hypothetical protein DWV68_14210 [Roseburia sp. AF12-17LB]
MNKMNRHEIIKLLDCFEPQKFNYTIWILANVNDTIQNEESFIHHANFSEFFSKAEFACIASAITELFGYVRIFYSETEFMQYVLGNTKTLSKEDIIVFNFTRDGFLEGKKSLIPAFCDLYGLKYVSSNAFVISLLRNKFVYTQFLSSLNIKVPFTTCSKMITNDLFNKIKDKDLIIKNIFESASIGLDETNIINVADYDTMNSEMEKFYSKMQSDNLLIQEYIHGNECEVFVIRCGGKLYSFPPISVNINNSSIITTRISDEYDYTFSPLYECFSRQICNSIQKSAEKAADLLNIKNYARFDYRVRKNGEFFLIDIAGSPYLTRHSSVEYLFTQLLGLKYSDIFLLIAAITVTNYSHEVNCKSDNGKPLEM